MTLNVPECKVLTVTRKKSPVTHQYYLGNTYIKRVLEEEDLGSALKQFIVGLACYAYCTRG